MTGGFQAKSRGSEGRTSKRQPKLEDYSPRRFALQFCPAVLVVEYFVPKTKKLYLKKIMFRD